MTEWQKFKESLSKHPGKELATIYSLPALAIGLCKGLATGLLTGAIGSIFWIPVLITAWTDRNKDK